jgi:hypothetical protein
MNPIRPQSALDFDRLKREKDYADAIHTVADAIWARRNRMPEKPQPKKK